MTNVKRRQILITALKLFFLMKLFAADYSCLIKAIDRIFYGLSSVVNRHGLLRSQRKIVKSPAFGSFFPSIFSFSSKRSAWVYYAAKPIRNCS